MSKVLIKCDNCGEEFFKYSSRIAKHNFCNRKCYQEYHSKDIKEYICEICGKSFKGSKYNANRFCSRECYNAFHSIKNKVRICPTCKKEFIAKCSEDKYCSKECYNKNRNMPKGENHWNWQGGISKINDRKDSNDYKQWRKQVYQRDNYTCQYCGSKEKINAHHIKSWKDFPELRYDVNNGITLCEKCHINLHKTIGYK